MKHRFKIISSGLIIVFVLFSAAAQKSWQNLTPEILEGLNASVYLPSIATTAFINNKSIYYVSENNDNQEVDMSLYEGGMPNGWTNFTGAVKWDDQTIMLFNNNEYALFNLEAASITYRGPFPDIPTKVDAITNWGDSQILFFSGIHYVIYDKNDQTISAPIAISDFSGFNLNTLDAVLNGYDGFIYFFSQGRLQILDTNHQTFSTVTTLKPISSGLPPVVNTPALPPIANTINTKRQNTTIAINTNSNPIEQPVVLDTSNWCLLGTPQYDSEAELVSDVTAIEGSDLGDSSEDDVEAGSRISEIRVWGGRVVSAIQSVLQNTEGEFIELPIMGTKKGRMQTYTVPEGACITGIDGQFGGDYGQYIHNLTFITNKGKSKKIGGPGKKIFKIRLNSKVSFYGFKVHHTNNLSGIALKYVGYEDNMPVVENQELASHEENKNTKKGKRFKDKFIGEYDDQHVDYIKTELTELQGGGNSTYSKGQLPASDWLGKAVDVLTLDPLSIAQSPTKRTIIRLIPSNNSGGLVGDEFLPHGTHFSTSSGGSDTVEKLWMESYSDLTTKFNVGVQANVGTPIGGGSLSASYSQMNNTKMGNEEIYFTRIDSRNQFNVKMDLLFSDPESGDLKRQLLDYDFRRMIDNLPVPANAPKIKPSSFKKGRRLPAQIERVKNDYMKVIERYGTHFVEEADFGGKFVSHTIISKETYENTRMTETEFKASAEAQIKAVNIGASVEFGYGTKSIIGNKKGKLNTMNFIQGGNGENYHTWNTSVSKYAVPIKVKVRPISDLLIKEFWPQHHDINKRQATLLAIINQYLVDNKRDPVRKTGNFFSEPKAVNYTYTMTITGIKCTAINDNKLDGAANIYGYINAGYKGTVGNKKVKIWDLAKSASIDIKKGAIETINENIKVVANGKKDGAFIIQGGFKDALSNGMAGFGKAIGTVTEKIIGKTASYGSKSLKIPFSEIPETPKEYKIKGFNYDDTKLEIMVSVSKKPDYVKDSHDDNTKDNKED